METKPLSYSANATLQSCARKYNYRYVQGLVPFEDSIPAFAGKCMAEALLWVHTEGKEVWKLDPDKAHQNAMEVLESAWGDFAAPTGKYDYLTVGHLETVLFYYLEEREWNQVLPLAESGKILAEQKETFEWPVLEDGEVVDLMKITGIPDLPAKINGQNVVVDWKCTTMYVNEWWAKKFSVIGHQLRTYMEMLRHHYGIHVETAYVDGIHIGKKASESSAAWNKVQSVRSRLFGPFNFSESQRQETLEWYRAGNEMRSLFKSTGRWPQNEGACSAYGGCEYQRLCGLSPQVRNAQAKMMFKVEEEQ